MKITNKIISEIGFKNNDDNVFHLDISDEISMTIIKDKFEKYWLYFNRCHPGFPIVNVKEIFIHLMQHCLMVGSEIKTDEIKKVLSL